MAQNLDKLLRKAQRRHDEKQLALFSASAPKPVPVASHRPVASPMMPPVPTARPIPFVYGDLVRDAAGEVRKVLTMSITASGTPFVFMVDVSAPGDVHINGYRIWGWDALSRWRRMMDAEIAMDPRVRRLLPAVRAARAGAQGHAPIRQDIGRALAGRRTS